VAARGGVPEFFRDACHRIADERRAGVSDIHVLTNCPIDEVIPELSPEDPVRDKHERKTTFVAEALLELFAQLTGVPLLAYGSRNNGDFFTDVIAIKKYEGKQTGFSDSELVMHNDRTAHWARADFITLLGLRCPEEEVIYTSYVDGRDVLAFLTPRQHQILRQKYFYTPFDVFSRDTNSKQTVSENHPVLENDHSLRYLETHTSVTDDAPPEAKDTLIALKNAVVRAEKKRHRMQVGDLLVFANQDGLHSRDRMEIHDRERAATRWLLKTYAFRDEAAADRLSDKWQDGVRGRIAD
jgi:hypothetical protein